MENLAKLNSSKNVEIINVKLDKEKFPIAYKNKLDELTQSCGMSKEKAEKYLETCVIPMELIYHKDYGLFMVESEAIECSTIYSPYTGEECDDSELD